MNLYDITVGGKLFAGSGGGGGGDFTTAQVTLYGAYPSPNIFTIPILDSYDEICPVAEADNMGNTVTVPLYKGSAAFIPSNDYEYTVTGSIVYDDDVYVITGDCTITASL